MKKLIMFMFIAFLGFAVNAQTAVTEVTPDSYIGGPAYEYIFGTTSDTIEDADNTSHVIRIKGNYTQDYTIKLYNDWVSGTAGGTLVTYSSIDGVNYETTEDTITIASVTADAMDSETITLSDYNSPYLKATYTQTGTAVTIPKVFIYTKKN